MAMESKGEAAPNLAGPGLENDWIWTKRHNFTWQSRCCWPRTGWSKHDMGPAAVGRCQPAPPHQAVPVWVQLRAVCGYPPFGFRGPSQPIGPPSLQKSSQQPPPQATPNQRSRATSCVNARRRPHPVRHAAQAPNRPDAGIPNCRLVPPNSHHGWRPEDMARTIL